MLHQISQKQWESKLESIKNRKTSPRVKILMLKAFVQFLKDGDRGKGKQNLSTSFSENESNFSTFEQEIEELEEKILQKRAIKFQINEEIEGTEDNLYQLEKVIDTKRNYDQKLKKQINRKMNSIQDQNKKTPDKNKSYLNKSVGVVSNFLKGWIN